MLKDSSKFESLNMNRKQNVINKIRKIADLLRNMDLDYDDYVPLYNHIKDAMNAACELKEE